MANSLFDQLKKSGLVDDKKAKKIKHEKHQAKKQNKGKNKPQAPSEATLLAQKAQAEKVEKDRQLNQQRKQAAEAKAIAAQIKQLIESNRIQDREGDIAYNFNDTGKVARLYVTETLQTQLAKGQLAIVRLDDTYQLVPTAVAEKIRQRDEACVIYCDSAKHEEKAEDDPYADYQVPDDLMW